MCKEPTICANEHQCLTAEKLMEEFLTNNMPASQMLEIIDLSVRAAVTSPDFEDMTTLEKAELCELTAAIRKLIQGMQCIQCMKCLDKA